MLCFQACENEGDDNNIDGNVTNGSEYVDLGLSVKWATCNVGANSPEEYGDYFAWGEVSPKENYTERNSVTYHDSLIGDISGNVQYDAATANLGGSWRMPTKTECQELIDHCSSEWITRNGVNGTLFTSNINGNSIFLPAAGTRHEEELNNDGTVCYYLSSTPYEDNDYCAYHLAAGYGGLADIVIWNRGTGCTVRPVTE